MFLYIAGKYVSLEVCGYLHRAEDGALYILHLLYFLILAMKIIQKNKHRQGSTLSLRASFDSFHVLSAESLQTLRYKVDIMDFQHLVRLTSTRVIDSIPQTSNSTALSSMG